MNNHFYFFIPILPGVPQGSVLGPILYLIYTADIPTTGVTDMATFADDTAILASHLDPNTASHNLQTHLHSLQNWFRKWKFQVNETKSVHVTFTLNRDVCPPSGSKRCHTTSGRHQVSRYTSGQALDVAKTRLSQAQTTGFKTSANVLVNWPQLSTST
jgi:hypothetical protein